MKELLVDDLSQKFASARRLRPGMSEEVYAVTDYLATLAGDNYYSPDGMVNLVCFVSLDLNRKRCTLFDSHDARSTSMFPEYFVKHSDEVLEQLPYILQVIDAIVDVEYTEAVREKCRVAFKWEIPKHVETSDKVSEYEYIDVAVRWWAERIQCPSFRFFGGTGRQFTEEELRIFRKKLAESVTSQMEHRDRMSLRVEYHPDQILQEAGDMLGLDQMFYPWKTDMSISESKVEVSVGNGAQYRTIWEAAQ